MKAKIKWTAGAMAVALCAALAACGGGGGSGGASGTTAPTTNSFDISIAGGPFTANVGDAIQIQGNSTTSAHLIRKMSWTVIANDATAPALTLGNADCTSAIKNDVKFAANGQSSTGTSQWTCALAVAASNKLTKNSTYKVALSVTDDTGNIQTQVSAITYNVTPGGTGTGSTLLTANAGLGFTTAPGTSNTLHCSASGGDAPYTYQWSVTANAGLNVPLSTYSGADTSFTAPAVSSSTNLTFMCVATDNSQNSATSTVTVTDASQVTTNALVANAGKGLNVNPGQTVILDGSATGWFTGTGTPTSGGTITYQWSTTLAGVTINNPNAPTTTFVAPTTILTATTIPFTLTATSAGLTSSATVNFLVDPFAPFTLSVNPAAQAFIKVNGAAVTISANASTTNGTPTVYYQWTQTSGPAVTLGGQQTATVGFVPTVLGVYTFRVAVGYQPISATYTGVYFADATVTVQ